LVGGVFVFGVVARARAGLSSLAFALVDPLAPGGFAALVGFVLFVGFSVRVTRRLEAFRAAALRGLAR
jgi:hypothetical protein